MRKAIGVILLITAAAALMYRARSLAADIIILKNGNKIEGTVEELDENRIRVLLKRGSVTLERKLIKKIIRIETDRQIYEKRLKRIEQKSYKLEADKVKDLFELYDFCREKELEKEARALLETILEIEPDNERAKFEKHEWETLDKARQELAREWREKRSEKPTGKEQPLEEQTESVKRKQLEEALMDVSTEGIVVEEGSGFDRIRIRYKKDFIIKRFGEPQVSERPPRPLSKWAEALDVEYEYYSYSYLPIIFVIFKPKGTIEAMLFEKDFRGRLKRGVKIGSTRDLVYKKYGKPRRTLDISSIKYPYLPPRVLYVSGRSRPDSGKDKAASGAPDAEWKNVNAKNYSIIYYPKPFNLTFYFDENKKVERFFATTNIRRRVKKKRPPSKRRT